jgi:hypothetical protein
MGWTGSVARVGNKRTACRILVGKSEGKIPLERHRWRKKNNIKMEFREIQWGDVDWIHLAQDRDKYRAFVNTIMNLPVPQNLGKFLSS